MLGSYVDQLFTAIYFTTDAFAAYFLVSKITRNVYDVIASIRSGVLPTLSYFIGEEEKEEKVFKLFLKFMILVASLPFLIASLYSDLIIKILLTPQFYKESFTLSLLFIAAFFAFVKMVLYYMALSKGYVRFLPVITSISLVSRISFMFILSIFGSVGIAIANMFAEFISIVIFYLKYNELIKIERIFLIKLLFLSSITYYIACFLKTGTILMDLFFAALTGGFYLVGLGVIKTLKIDEIEYLIKTRNRFLVIIGKIFKKLWF